jgi:hypothetical protein
MLDEVKPSDVVHLQNGTEGGTFMIQNSQLPTHPTVISSGGGGPKAPSPITTGSSPANVGSKPAPPISKPLSRQPGGKPVRLENQGNVMDGEMSKGDLLTRRGNRIDALTGRVVLEHVATGKKTTKAAREAAQQYNVDFDAGHLRSNLLGGKGDLENTFPQWAHVNRGMFRIFEGRLADLVKTSAQTDRIYISVQPRYRSSTAEVPSEVYYQVRINGRTVERALFGNEPGNPFMRTISYGP